MPNSLSEAPRDIRRIVKAAAKVLDEDPEAVYDELGEHFGGKEGQRDLGAPLVGLDAVAAYLGMTRRTVARYMAKDREFRGQFHRGKSGYFWSTFENLVRPWRSIPGSARETV